MKHDPGHPRRETALRLAVLLAGPLLAAAAYAVLPVEYLDQNGDRVEFTHAGRASAALAVWMATWWLTEAIDLSATALLPLVVLPLAGAASITGAAAPYAHDLIFLFMGGFILSLSMQRWNLHRRIALRTLALFGTSPPNIVGGFMAATAGLSMWLSNTATAVMMLPIAQSVIAMREPDRTAAAPAAASGGFPPALMLGIAYAASIGGITTIIGSPPNLLAVSYVRDRLGAEISFAQWMAVGVPLALLMLPVAWLLLTRVVCPVDHETGRSVPPQALELAPINRGAQITLAVFAFAVVGWLFRPLLANLAVAGIRPLAGLTDSGVAMIAALALFVIPVDLGRREFTMDWDHAVRLPWGILILFGGGLSLAAAIDINGVGAFLGAQVSSFRGLHPGLILTLVVAMVLFLTELTSNTATAATLVPILAGLAPGLGVHPFLLIIPTAIAASWAFMLPVATPPNAIVFGSGYVTLGQMRSAGLWLNLAGLVILSAFMYWVALPLLGVDPRP